MAGNRTSKVANVNFGHKPLSLSGPTDSDDPIVGLASLEMNLSEGRSLQCILSGCGSIATGGIAREKAIKSRLRSNKLKVLLCFWRFLAARACRNRHESRTICSNRYSRLARKTTCRAWGRFADGIVSDALRLAGALREGRRRGDKRRPEALRLFECLRGSLEIRAVREGRGGAESQVRARSDPRRRHISLVHRVARRGSNRNGRPGRDSTRQAGHAGRRRGARGHYDARRYSTGPADGAYHRATRPYGAAAQGGGLSVLRGKTRRDTAANGAG